MVLSLMITSSQFIPYAIGICNSYSIKSLYFSGFSMTPLLSRELEPIWFAGMPSQRKTSLYDLLGPELNDHGWVPASLGSGTTHLPAAQGLCWLSTWYIWQSLLLWRKKHAMITLQPAIRLRVVGIYFPLQKKKKSNGTFRKVWRNCFKRKRAWSQCECVTVLNWCWVWLQYAEGI